MVYRRFVTRSDDFLQQRQRGKQRGSCRLWHKDQELKAGSVKREEALCAVERGGAHRTKPPRSFPSPSARSFSSSLLSLDLYQM
ncbi:hypothetical protein PBY51_009737 [Eleginops maclovinus]|uniref:Uncharacterized protein n=1 Tax=Eleginops maclovinus TaxID=56733 RepID=A0AAN7XWT2_ELEMC|nr:hypothetical protein PBY51_009737 [Eleginops maclovinus]